MYEGAITDLPTTPGGDDHEPIPRRPIRRDDGRNDRLYFACRRFEIAAPVNAAAELGAWLLDQPKVRACEPYRADLETIRRYAIDFVETLGRVGVPAPDRPEVAGVAMESVATALNHEIRSLLTVVIGYSEDLASHCSAHSLNEFSAELEQIHRLGQRTLGLLDEVVAYLKGPSIPASAVATEAAEVAPPAARPGVGEGPEIHPGRILIAEDDPAIREVLARYLARLGHEVRAACDGAEALDLILDWDPELILLDILMPRADGFQVLKRLKSDPTLREIPVVMISGLDDMEGIAHCIGLGAEDVLPKPFNRVMLRARVGSCLEKKRLRDRAEQQRRRYDELLHEILPAPVVAQLAESKAVPPRKHEDVAVLFADIKGFTTYCDGVADRPEVVVGHLQALFEAWDEIAARHGVQKIKTIGDAFMAAAGLLRPDADAVAHCVRCGFEMIEATRRLSDGWELRVGVHVGPVVAGVLGRRQYLYDLWGDTVNTASRVESNGLPGWVNLSLEAWGRLSGRREFEATSSADIKVKGKSPMTLMHLRPLGDGRPSPRPSVA